MLTCSSSFEVGLGDAAAADEALVEVEVEVGQLDRAGELRLKAARLRSDLRAVDEPAVVDARHPFDRKVERRLLEDLILLEDLDADRADITGARRLAAGGPLHCLQPVVPAALLVVLARRE